MKILGITAEYNPFHNGHAYHVQKARELSGADCAIAVMSGDFTQRGEPACADKWARAAAAVRTGADSELSGGVDAVFELPFAFACNRAQYFAAGGVDMLVRLGCSCISFGCEAEAPDELVRLAGMLSQKADELELKTAEYMKSGVSRAKAYETAVEEILGRDAACLITSPNNILAVEYLKRINYWKSRGIDLRPVPVVRIGSTYGGVADLGGRERSDLCSRDFAGASAIRRMQREGGDVSRFMPVDIAFEDYGAIESRYFTLLKALVTRSSAEELAEIYSIGEGFENKIKKEIASAQDWDSYISVLVSKRYSSAAVKRMLTYVLLGAEGSEMDRMTDAEVCYARLLAAGPKGREFIRNFKSEEFEIITNINKAELSGTDLLLHEMDVKAADMYSVLCGRKLYEGSDKVRKPTIV